MLKEYINKIIKKIEKKKLQKKLLMSYYKDWSYKYNSKEIK